MRSESLDEKCFESLDVADGHCGPRWPLEDEGQALGIHCHLLRFDTTGPHPVGAYINIVSNHCT